jgi:hypothetical protein
LQATYFAERCFNTLLALSITIQKENDISTGKTMQKHKVMSKSDTDIKIFDIVFLHFHHENSKDNRRMLCKDTALVLLH